jgi:hypothetical protein
VRLEQLPILVGVLVLFVSLAIGYDSMSAEERRPFKERRRRQRAELNRGGELLVAMGTASMAAALIGRDSWRWGTIAVFIGVVFLIAGASLNRTFLRELLLFRGAARRATKDDAPPVATDVTRPKMRIR